MELKDATDGTSHGAKEGSVGRVGDDPAVFTMGMVTIGLVLGVFIGLTVWTLVIPDGTTSRTEQVSEDLDALSMEVDLMMGLVDLVDERAASSAWELDAARGRLDGMRTALGDVEIRLAEVRVELDRNMGSISGASEDLVPLREDLLDLRMELMALQLELDDLIAQILAGGGSGGNGSPTVPENATLLASPHLSHYSSSFLTFSCGMCHDAEPEGDVIVSKGKMYWNGTLDDPGFNTVIDQTTECLECHGQFAETGMEPGYIDVSCVACHDDWADRMTATYVKETAVTADDCLLCHGGPNAFIDEPQKY